MERGRGQHGEGEQSAWEGGGVSIGRGRGQHGKEEWSAWGGGVVSMGRGVVSMGRGSGQHGKGEWSAWEEEWSVWADLHTVIGEVMTWWEGRGGVCVGVCINCGTILSDPIILCVRHRCISNSNSE